MICLQLAIDVNAPASCKSSNFLKQPFFLRVRQFDRRGYQVASSSFRRASREGAAILERPVSDRGTLEDLSQSAKFPSPRDRKLLILKRRDVRVVEGARLEIALTVCDGVLQISITVAKPTT